MIFHFSFPNDAARPCQPPLCQILFSEAWSKLWIILVNLQRNQRNFLEGPMRQSFTLWTTSHRYHCSRSGHRHGPTSTMHDIQTRVVTSDMICISYFCSDFSAQLRAHHVQTTSSMHFPSVLAAHSRVRTWSASGSQMDLLRWWTADIQPRKTFADWRSFFESIKNF